MLPLEDGPPGHLADPVKLNWHRPGRGWHPIRIFVYTVSGIILLAAFFGLCFRDEADYSIASSEDGVVGHKPESFAEFRH